MFFLKNFDSFPRTPTHQLKMNAVAHAQLVFQILTLQTYLMLITLLKTLGSGPIYCLLLGVSSDYAQSQVRARFLSLALSKLRLCLANHRPGYFSNLACDWLSIVWAYSMQETENRPRILKWLAEHSLSLLRARERKQILDCQCIGDIGDTGGLCKATNVVFGMNP